MAEYLGLFADYLDLFSRLVWKFKNPDGAPRRALGPSLWPPLRSSEPAGPARGNGEGKKAQTINFPEISVYQTRKKISA